MGLQYYDIKLGLTSTQKVAAQGRYIYYLNGATALIRGGVTPSAAGNQAIKVQAGQTGNTLILMPGQSYRVPSSDKAPSEWIITNAVGAEVITGQLLIGEGDFHDSNTSNTNYLKLDATFANNVTVANTPAQRVPVTADITQTIPVSIAGTVNVAGTTVNYTNAWADAGTAGVSAQQIFSAASNVNGAYLEFAEVAMSSIMAGYGTVVSIVAKATNPNTQTDGDVLMVVNCSTGSGAPPAAVVVNQILGQRIKIPAGKGLWLVQTVTGTGADKCNKTVLYTLL